MNRRRVTLADVARAAGVSRTTASLVLSDRGDELRISEASQHRVRQVATELGYRPNQLSVNLRSGSSRTIAFISDTIATSQLAGDMIKGALEQAHLLGYMVLIGETEGDLAEEARLIEAMQDRQVDGIVLASMFTRERAVPRGLEHGPVVLLNAVPEHPAGIPAVIPDEYVAGREAARLVVEAGHERVHLIGAGPTMAQVPPGTIAGRERLAGILDGLADAGLEPESAELCSVWLPEDGREATTRLLARGARSGAMITFNDRLAFGAYQALQEAGLRVPDDVSIVSFDDHQLAGWLQPGLTTFAIPHRDLGRRAIELLFAGRDEAGHDAARDRPAAIERVPMPLRVRGSLHPVPTAVPAGARAADPA